jgi:outer membrane protein TolC
VEAAAGAVGKARALLLPTIEANLIADTLDKDRAIAALGQYPERVLAGELVGRQVIFSEKAWANLSIQGDIEDAKKAQHEILRIDIATQAAQAYINVLRAHMLERIRVDNLQKTRSNLDLARVRSTAGTAGAAEVYRWDNQLANDRRAVVAAQATVSAAQIALNQLIHHPLEEPFSTEAQNLGGDELLITPQKIAQFTSTPQSFALFRQFMVEEAEARVPELQALDKSIAALERAVLSAKATLFMPTLGVEVRARHNFLTDGVGTKPLRIPPPLNQALKFPFVGADTWSIGAILNLPVFSGFGDWSELNQRQAELARQTEERSAAAEKIEQRVRTALHLAGASYQSISLAQDSATAAKKGLDIVTNAYAQGSLGILDLLDAQNAVLVSDQLVVGAVNESMLDQLAVQRALGWLAFLATPADATAFLDKATQYVSSHGEAPKP